MTRPASTKSPETTTVRALIARGVPAHCLPVLDPDAPIELVPTAGTRFNYWFRYVEPNTGDHFETRGRELEFNQRLVGRVVAPNGDTSETWAS
jgi:hypothetical protein